MPLAFLQSGSNRVQVSAMKNWLLAVSLLSCVLSSSISHSADIPPPVLITSGAQGLEEHDAARLLTQATYGPTIPAIEQVLAIGGPAAWCRIK